MFKTSALKKKFGRSSSPVLVLKKATIRVTRKENKKKDSIPVD